MNKGFSLPILLLVLSVLIILPAAIWQHSHRTESVKGVSTHKETILANGFSVYVESQEGTWDLLEYLCKDRESCVEDLESGERWGNVSGAKTDYHEVLVDYSFDWEGYQYVKVFVRPSWHQSSRIFEVKDRNVFEGAELVEISSNGQKIEVLLIPVAQVKDTFHKTVLFTDALD